MISTNLFPDFVVKQRTRVPQELERNEKIGATIKMLEENVDGFNISIKNAYAIGYAYIASVFEGAIVQNNCELQLLGLKFIEDNKAGYEIARCNFYDFENERELSWKKANDVYNTNGKVYAIAEDGTKCLPIMLYLKSLGNGVKFISLYNGNIISYQLRHEMKKFAINKVYETKDRAYFCERENLIKVFKLHDIINGDNYIGEYNKVSVNLSTLKNVNDTRKSVHRLVALLSDKFDSEVEIGAMVVNHMNLKRNDNSIFNLEVVTDAENVAHGRYLTKLKTEAGYEKWESLPIRVSATVFNKESLNDDVLSKLYDILLRAKEDKEYYKEINGRYFGLDEYNNAKLF